MLLILNKQLFKHIGYLLYYNVINTNYYLIYFYFKMVSTYGVQLCGQNYAAKKVPKVYEI